MWVRKRFDIAWSDLALGVLNTCLPRDRAAIQRDIEEFWSASDDTLAFLSVRSGFDLLLKYAELPPGSEVLISAITIKDMVRIVEHHNLVPVPVDLDLDSLAPKLDVLRRAITPKTRAILVAHLCGSRVPMEPIIKLAGEHKLLVIEDCAQAFAGRQYKGHPESDVSMFSFGPIKTATALGGAVLRVRRRQLLRRMRQQQATYPVQGRFSYFRRLLKYSAMKAGSVRPFLALVVRACRLIRFNHDHLFNGSARSFPGPRFFSRIRQQPCTPLLALLRRRLQTYDPRRLAQRASKGELLVRLLHDRVPCPGAAASGHTHWVFPVRVDDPAGVISSLAAAGFDATQGQSMIVVPPPPDRPELDPRAARDGMAKIVYLPFYPEMPTRSLERMAKVLLRQCGPLPAGSTDSDDSSSSERSSEGVMVRLRRALARR